MTEQTPSSPGRPSVKIDTSVAHPARVWDYWLEGKDHYASDREVGEQILHAVPVFRQVAQADRQFLGRAVRYLAGEQGIRQFLDIGTGIPTANNTHQVAQQVAPDSRIVYVDNDPVVLAHARALLTSSPEGVTDYIDSDMREPAKIVEKAQKTLDFSQPVAVSLLGVLEFIPETSEAKSIIGTLLAELPSGSYLVVSAPQAGDEMNKAAQLWNESGAVTVTIRSREDVASLFDGLELVEPGIVALPKWRPDDDTRFTDVDVPYLGALGRKP